MKFSLIALMLMSSVAVANHSVLDCFEKFDARIENGPEYTKCVIESKDEIETLEEMVRNVFLRDVTPTLEEEHLIILYYSRVKKAQSNVGEMVTFLDNFTSENAVLFDVATLLRSSLLKNIGITIDHGGLTQ